MKPLGFGLDLAGYSTGKSVLAAAKAKDAKISIAILTNCPFSKKLKLTDNRTSVQNRELQAFSKLLAMGPVAVDVPIDLQGLPFDTQTNALWGQSKRPIDYLLNALPPLGDKLGVVVSRFRCAINDVLLSKHLGIDLFETYPAASLHFSGQIEKGYKGKDNIEKLERLCHWLCLDSVDLNDDEFDAVICALTSIAEQSELLEGEVLLDLAPKKGTFSAADLPKGYRLINIKPDKQIEVQRLDYKVWIEDAYRP